VSPVRYELGFYILEYDIRHSHCRGNLKPFSSIVILISDNINSHSSMKASLTISRKVICNRQRRPVL
jgi:hypothetical protein